MPLWVSLGHKDAEKTRVEEFVDASSIGIHGNIRQAWWTTVLPAHTLRDRHTNAGPWLSAYAYHDLFNCADGTARSIARKIQYDDGHSANAPASPESKGWHALLPDSTGELAMKFVCSWQQK